MSIKKMVFTPVREVTGEKSRRVLDTEVWLMFAKSEYLIREYVPTMQNVDFENGIV